MKAHESDRRSPVLTLVPAVILVSALILLASDYVWRAHINDAYLPGRTQVDVAVGKEIRERWMVAVNALNINNSHLLIDNSLTFGGFHYDNPREVYVQVRYKFHY